MPFTVATPAALGWADGVDGGGLTDELDEQSVTEAFAREALRDTSFRFLDSWVDDTSDGNSLHLSDLDRTQDMALYPPAPAQQTPFQQAVTAGVLAQWAQWARLRRTARNQLIAQWTEAASYWAKRHKLVAFRRWRSVCVSERGAGQRPHAGKGRGGEAVVNVGRQVADAPPPW